MYEKESNGYIVLFSWAVFLAFGISLFIFGSYKSVKDLSGRTDMPEELFGNTGEYFYDFLRKIGDIGQVYYYNFQLFDYVNLFLLGITLFLTIRHILIKLQVRKLFWIAIIFPFLFILFDFLENSLILFLLYKLPDKFYNFAKLVSDLTRLKLIFGSLSFLSILIGGIFLLIKKLKGNS